MARRIALTAERWTMKVRGYDPTKTVVLTVGNVRSRMTPDALVAFLARGEQVVEEARRLQPKTVRPAGGVLATPRPIPNTAAGDQEAGGTNSGGGAPNHSLPLARRAGLRYTVEDESKGLCWVIVAREMESPNVERRMVVARFYGAGAELAARTCSVVLAEKVSHAA